MHCSWKLKRNYYFYSTSVQNIICLFFFFFSISFIETRLSQLLTLTSLTTFTSLSHHRWPTRTSTPLAHQSSTSNSHAADPLLRTKPLTHSINPCYKPISSKPPTHATQVRRKPISFIPLTYIELLGCIFFSFFFLLWIGGVGGGGGCGWWRRWLWLVTEVCGGCFYYYSNELF